MKVRISLTLSRDVLAKIDRVKGPKQSRSALIESVLAAHLRTNARAARDARDIAIINRHAEELNLEALDGLEYQAPLGDLRED